MCFILVFRLITYSLGFIQVIIDESSSLIIIHRVSDDLANECTRTRAFFIHVCVTLAKTKDKKFTEK